MDTTELHRELKKNQTVAAQSLSTFPLCFDLASRAICFGCMAIAPSRVTAFSYRPCLPTSAWF